MTQQPSGRELRLLFEKTGPIRFISHLDLTRAFHRAFARAEIPLKFSEGFSPHPKFSFALPLSVGTESLTEYADFSLKEGYDAPLEKIRADLNAQMPDGITVKSVFPREGKLSDIAFASYTVFLPKVAPSVISKLEEALKETIVIQKKNKKGKWVEKDITEGILSVTFSEQEGGIEMKALLSAAGESYLKPETLLDALSEKAEGFDPREKRILRTKVFRTNKTEF